LGRDWTPDELEAIRSVANHWPRTAKLTPEQVKLIRERVDSLTMPWTVAELAREFGVTGEQIINIARRVGWSERTYEPDGKKWWKER